MSIYRIVIGSIVPVDDCKSTCNDAECTKTIYITASVWCHVPFSQPRFLSTPAIIEGNLNESVLIPCVIHDLGQNQLKWWKDNILLSDSLDDSLITPPRVTLLTNNMLLIDWLEASDSGNYTCEIVRPYPRLPLQQVHTVKVRHPPEVTAVPSNYVEVKLGSEVQLGCIATGWPTPTVTWKFNDEVIKSVDNRHSLKFVADDVSKSGVYQCEASNDVGKPASSSILLMVLYPPDIKQEKSWVNSSPGLKTDIGCTVTGEPRPKVEWLYEGETLQFDSSRMSYRVRGNKHILSFRNVLDTDFGRYSCHATNKMGEVRKDIKLTGVAGPAVLKKAKGFVPPGSYRLVWEVDSYSPIIEYMLRFSEVNNVDKDWIKLIIPADGDSPGPLHSKSYTLSGLKRFTLYQADLTSRNRYGWSDPSEKITFGSDQITELLEAQEAKPVSHQMTGGQSRQTWTVSMFLILVSTVRLIS